MKSNQIIVRCMLRKQLLFLEGVGNGYWLGKFQLVSHEEIVLEIERRRKNNPDWIWIFS